MIVIKTCWYAPWSAHFCLTACADAATCACAAQLSCACPLPTSQWASRVSPGFKESTCSSGLNVAKRGNLQEALSYTHAQEQDLLQLRSIFFSRLGQLARERAHLKNRLTQASQADSDEPTSIQLGYQLAMTKEVADKLSANHAEESFVYQCYAFCMFRCVSPCVLHCFRVHNLSFSPALTSQVKIDCSEFAVLDSAVNGLRAKAATISTGLGSSDPHPFSACQLGQQAQWCLQMHSSVQHATVMVHSYPNPVDVSKLLEVLAQKHKEPSVSVLLEPSGVDDLQHAARLERLRQYIAASNPDSPQAYCSFLKTLTCASVDQQTRAE